MRARGSALWVPWGGQADTGRAGGARAARQTPPRTVVIQCHLHLRTLAGTAPCEQKHHKKTAGRAAAKIFHLQVQLWQALLKSLEAADAPVMDAAAHVFEALLGGCCLQPWCLLPVASDALHR